MSDSNSNLENEVRLFSVSNSLKHHTRLGLCTVIGAEDPSHGELVGSGIFVAQGENIFLVTAAHVLKEAFKFPLPVHSVGDHRRPVPFKFKAYAVDDPEDIAVVRVEREDIDPLAIAPFDISCLGDSSYNLTDDILFIHGYPEKRSRFFQMANGVVSESLPYGTFEGVSALPEFTPQVHFAIEYDQLSPQKDEQGKTVYLPTPYGLSGSAVWKSESKGRGINWTPDAAQIVGLACKWDQTSRSLIVTRVESLRNLLKQAKLMAEKGLDAPKRSL